MFLLMFAIIELAHAGNIPKQGALCPDYSWDSYGEVCMNKKTTSWVWKQGAMCPDYEWNSYGGVCWIEKQVYVLPKQGFSCPDYSWDSYGDYCLKSEKM